MSSNDIVQFELAGSVEKAAFIFGRWEVKGLTALFVRSVYLDFVFLVLYCYALSCLTRTLAGGFINLMLRKAGVFIANVIWAAGVCDAVENVAMLRSVTVAITETSVLVTEYMAIVKFSLVLLAFIYIMIATGYLGFLKLKS